jgi:gliding motility-associated-like protein
MRRLFNIFLFIFLWQNLHSQILVPNYNFEEPSIDFHGICCGNDSLPNVSYRSSFGNACAKHWGEVGPYHFGVIRPCFPPPFHPGGGVYPLPRYGSSIGQLMTLGKIPGGPFAGRFLAIELTNPLQSNATYCVEFFLQHSRISTGICRSPGILFTDTVVQNSQFNARMIQNPPIVPQIHFPNYLVNNTSSWDHLRGSFVAHGGERYLNFGAFYSQADTAGLISPTSPVTGPWTPNMPPNIAFWLVDAIVCYKCSDTLFTVNIGRDTLLCPGESVALHAYYEGFKLQDTSVVFNWQTPTGPRADSTVVANTPGYYEVEVVINHRFRARHGVWVHFGPEPPTQDRYLPAFIELCEGHDTVLSLPNWDTTAYQWSTGTTGPSLRVALPGTYTVVAENFCWDHEESVTVTEKLCDQRMWIPNAFSPNGDGINDRFEIRGTWQTPIALWIFDRWGNVVFHSEAYQNDWAGTLPNGQPAMPGVYTWKITYRNTPTSGEREKHGTVVIVP